MARDRLSGTEDRCGQTRKLLVGATGLVLQDRPGVDGPSEFVAGDPSGFSSAAGARLLQPPSTVRKPYVVR